MRVAGLAVAGLVLSLALWQWREYAHECDLARASVRAQADSVTAALVGGLRSHRRMGRFFEEQLQSTLDELARAPGTRAVGLLAQDGSVVLASGRAELVAGAKGLPEEVWTGSGYTRAVPFELAPESAPGPGRGRGWRGGPGGGGFAGHDAARGRFATGGRFVAVLVLDREPTDALCRRAAWLRGALVLAGGLALAGLALAWLASVGLAEARARARVLEAESRHLRELGQVAAGLAHETRNPLGVIRGWAQRLAGSAPGSPETGEQVRLVLEECDRVAFRINQFLAFARPLEPVLEPVDLDALAAELTAILGPDLEPGGLSITHPGSRALTPDPARPPARVVRADREMLRQALFNLVQNAIQASPSGSAVDIDVVRTEDGKHRIEVRDRGPGVAPGADRSLFTPYYTTRPGGTGLGLSIVRRIAAAHGWSAGYTPRPGGGAVFWIDGLES